MSALTDHLDRLLALRDAMPPGVRSYDIRRADGQPNDDADIEYITTAARELPRLIGWINMLARPDLHGQQDECPRSWESGCNCPCCVFRELESDLEREEAGS